MIGTLVSMFGYREVEHHELDKSIAAFERTAISGTAAIERHIDANLSSVGAIKGFFESAPTVTRRNFRTFVAPMLQRNPAIRALEWIPRISASMREPYEASAREDGFADFMITEQTEDGQLAAAGERDAYYPVYFVEPFEGNEAALGFDMGSNHSRLAALKKARDSGKMTASARIALVQSGKSGVLIFNPVFRQEHPRNTVELRRANLIGFVLGVLQIDEVVNEALEAEKQSAPATGGIAYHLFDDVLVDGENARFVHSSQAQATIQAMRSARESIHLETSLDVGGRRWTIISKPVDPQIGHSVWQAWSILVLGLVLTGSLCGLLVVYTNRSRAVQELVEARTVELRNSEVRVRAIVDNTADGIITIDDQGIMDTVNPAAEKMFGYPASELLGRNVSMLLPPESRDEHPQYVANSRLHASRIISQARDLEGFRKDGTLFPMELNVSHMEVAGKRMFVGILRDISERKQTERALENERSQADVLHAIAVAANEAETTDQLIQICLDLVCEFSGWPVGHCYIQSRDSADTLVPTGIWHLENPKRFAYFREVTQATNFEKGVGLPGRILAEGKPAWIRDVTEDANFPRAKMARDIGIRGAFALPVMVRSDVVAVLEFFSEEIREPGDSLLQAVGQIGAQVGRVFERQQITTIKNEFVSTVSHELRTPLTSIKGSLGLIRGGAMGGLPDKLSQMLDIAYTNADRLVRLINDILDIEKIEAGKMDFRMAPVELGELLRTALAANQGFAEECEVTLVIADTHSDAVVDGDEDRLLQVMANLLSNAAKFSPRNADVRISLSETAAGYRIAVADRGLGIPEKFRSKIFAKFSQADSSDTRQKGGTGLGLNISKAIVEKHGGTIGFDTDTGEGSTFFFDLPTSTN
ncbi:MAG: CHASE domain-containing protein [Rhodospirillales bacterium]|nr:CHASE domain-containing protein [Rhodospirillales bacterium]